MQSDEAITFEDLTSPEVDGRPCDEGGVSYVGTAGAARTIARVVNELCWCCRMIGEGAQPNAMQDQLLALLVTSIRTHTQVALMLERLAAQEEIQ